MPSRYSIKDLELISGIKAHTLRIWELRYHILEPQRTDTNIRYYSDTDLRKVLNISILNKNGYRISTIAHLNDEALRLEAEKYLENYTHENNKIENLYLALLAFDEIRFENILNNSIQHFGIEKAMEQVMFPFLKHLGNMWQTGSVSPAQEHYSSNLIRQKLVAELDRVVPAQNPQTKTYLFFLLEGELHELALLYACYLAKARGHRCVYLGQSVPLEDLISLAVDMNPECLVSIVTAERQEAELNALLKTCNETLTFNKFLLSGRVIFDTSKNIKIPSPRFQVFEQFSDFKNML